MFTPSLYVYIDEQFDPSLLGLDDDLSDEYGEHRQRDGDDSDAYNNARRKKVRQLEDNGDYRNGELRNLILILFPERMSEKRSERETCLSLPEYG